MFKKILSTLFLSIFLIFPSNLLSKSNTYDTIIELSRYKKIDNLASKINNLSKYTEQYILYTGDLNPDISKINTFFGITNPYIWKNGDNSGLLNIKLENNYIEIYNIFSQQPNKEIVSLFINNKNLPILSNIDENNITTIKISFTSRLDNFINIIKNLDINKNIVSTTEPIDKNLIWYKPNGIGGFELYKYNGKWYLYDTILINNKKSIKVTNIVDDIEKLFTLPKINGSIATVIDNGLIVEYIYDESVDKWVKISGSQDFLVNDIVNSIDPLLDRDIEKKYSNSYPGSIVQIFDFMSNKIVEFIKYNDYWLAENIYIRDILSIDDEAIFGNIYTAESLDKLPKQYIPYGSMAYIMTNNEGGNYRGNNDFPELIFNGTEWIYVVPNLDTLLSTVDGKNSISKIYFVNSYNDFFTFNSIGNFGEWYNDNLKIRASNGSRLDLSEGIEGWSYYTRNQCSTSMLCPKDNISEPRYTDSGYLSDIPSSNSIGKLYKWLPIDSPLSVNGLIDLPPCRDGYSLNLDKLRCEIDPICLSTYSYDKSINQCLIDPSCDSGTYYDRYLNKCAISTNCLDGSIYDPTVNSCVYVNAEISVGRVGDNYLSGWCNLYDYVTTISIDDVSKVTDFRLIYAKFDDYIKVEVNGNVVYVGPYGGDRLEVVWLEGTQVYESKTDCYGICSPVVRTKINKFSFCELNTNWSKSLNIDVKPYLRNGNNTFKITVEVTGYGEGYSKFIASGAGIKCISGYCNITATVTNPCPSGYIYSSGKCLKDPTCYDGAVFDGTLDKCKLAPYCRDSDSLFDYIDKLCYLNLI